MSQELLPRFPFGQEVLKEDLDNILLSIGRFTSFFWIRYEDQYPELDIPLGVITVGPNFVASGSRERLYKKMNSVEVDELTVDFAHMSRTNPLTVGGFGSQGKIEHLFKSLKNDGKLLPAYCLFPADSSEWERIKGSPKEERVSDDYLILNYDIEGEPVKVWVFDVLTKVSQFHLKEDGSQSITYDPTVFYE